MRLSTIIVSLALAVGLAIAGPAADPMANPAAEVVEGAPEPQFDDAPAPPAPGGEGVKGKNMVVGDAGLTNSKRGDFNPLDERGYAVLVLCPEWNCKGHCYAYNLLYQSGRCYPPPKYHYRSAYVIPYTRVHYGVYVGYCRHYDCYGMFAREYLIQRFPIIFIVRSRHPPPLRQKVLQRPSIYQLLVQEVVNAL